MVFGVIRSGVYGVVMSNMRVPCPKLTPHEPHNWLDPELPMCACPGVTVTEAFAGVARLPCPMTDPHGLHYWLPLQDERAVCPGVTVQPSLHAEKCWCGVPKVDRNAAHGGLSCPVHCTLCRHDRRFEDYYGFCSKCAPGEPCAQRSFTVEREGVKVAVGSPSVDDAVAASERRVVELLWQVQLAARALIESTQCQVAGDWSFDGSGAVVSDGLMRALCEAHNAVAEEFKVLGRLEEMVDG